MPNDTIADIEIRGREDLELTVLMPCLDEQDSIGACVAEARETLDRAGIAGEVLVVDNGSTDGSPELARGAGARVVHEPLRGYGYAYLRGFREAKGRYIVIGDSDGTYDFTLVPEFLERLRKGYDFVNGSRLKGEIDDGAISFLHRYVGVPILTWALNRFSGSRFSDAHCGMRGFSREAIDKMGLRTGGMELASEIILRAVRADLNTTELPIPYRARAGESKLRTFTDGWRHLRFMLLYSLTHLFLAPGAVLSAAGLILLLALVWGRLDIGTLSFDIHYMVVGSILAILGFQLVALGLQARVYALSIGLVNVDGLIATGTRYLTLERGLILGRVILAAGLGILSWIVASWVASDFSFDPTNKLRPALLGLTLVVIGAQAIFTSFFTGLLAIGLENRSREIAAADTPSNDLEPTAVR